MLYTAVKSKVCKTGGIYEFEYMCMLADVVYMNVIWNSKWNYSIL